MNKHLLIFPPLWNPEVPHIALPILSAQLNYNKFDTTVFDYNIDFFNYIYNVDFLENCLEKIKQNKSELAYKLEAYYGKNGKYKNRQLPYTYQLYKKIIENENSKFEEIPKLTDYALRIIKKQSTPKELAFAGEILKIANAVASVLYMPFDIDSEMILPPDFLFDGYEQVKSFVFSPNNIFKDFYNAKIKEIQNISPALIGISIGSSSQIVAGLTLSSYLKRETNAHINIGGDYFTRIKESIPEFKDFFELFADSISCGQGENSIVSLAQCVAKQKSKAEVDGLIWFDKKLIENKPSSPVNISELQYPDYSCYDLKKYFAFPNRLPLQTSSCCYWGKCTFCDCCYSNKYNEKNVDKFIDEIKFYIDNYQIRDFDMIDASVSPAFLSKFADKIIEDNISITFNFLARLEKQFTSELLIKLYRAGARKIYWGVESVSERILTLINKGIDKENISIILKNSAAAGIENRTFFFIGFPTETKEEAMQTVNYIISNKNIIHSSSMAIFHLGNHSIIAKNPEKYGIEILKKQNNFVPILKYSEQAGMSDEEKLEIYDYYIENKSV